VSRLGALLGSPHTVLLTRARPLPLFCGWRRECWVDPHYVRDVTLGEDASRIRTRPSVMARIRSVALNILRANGVQNISLALYANVVSFDQLLALGTA